VLETYLDVEPLTEIKNCIRKAALAGKIVPVICETFYRNKCLQKLFAAIIDYMLS
jgi:elongation factor G